MIHLPTLNQKITTLVARLRALPPTAYPSVADLAAVINAEAANWSVPSTLMGFQDIARRLGIEP